MGVGLASLRADRPDRLAGVRVLFSGSPAMMFEPLFERFTEGTPLSVMTRMLLENALQPKPLDELFERTAQKQYHRELLFSTVVHVMILAACRLYKSPCAVPTEQ